MYQAKLNFDHAMMHQPGPRCPLTYADMHSANYPAMLQQSTQQSPLEINPFNEMPPQNHQVLLSPSGPNQFPRSPMSIDQNQAPSHQTMVPQSKPKKVPRSPKKFNSMVQQSVPLQHPYFPMSYEQQINQINLLNNQDQSFLKGLMQPVFLNPAVHGPILSNYHKLILLKMRNGYKSTTN